MICSRIAARPVRAASTPLPSRNTSGSSANSATPPSTSPLDALSPSCESTSSTAASVRGSPFILSVIPAHFPTERNVVVRNEPRAQAGGSATLDVGGRLSLVGLLTADLVRHGVVCIGLNRFVVLSVLYGHNNRRRRAGAGDRGAARAAALRARATGALRHSRDDRICTLSRAGAVAAKRSHRGVGER